MGGIVPFTTIDLPDRLAAVVFCQGCAWNCEYCHNPHLRPYAPCPPDAPDADNKKLPWNEILAFLESRQGLIEGVVFSGGEPLLQRGLLGAVQQVKALGFVVGLHTAGPLPARFARVLPFLEWVGFDVKGPFEDYLEITGVDAGDAARESLRLLIDSGVDYQVRTTVGRAYLGVGARTDTLTRLASCLAEMGVRRYVLQECR